ncbi:MAG TPA: peptidylprolyl isomerase [Abditibacterium sp.]|jgi:cyclophilin family peptidyl-prolyl cis-trans isomerase
MKHLSLLPLLSVLFAGCSAPAAQEQTPPAAPAAAPETAPAKTYRVAEARNPDPAYQAAMKKVALPPPPLDTKIAPLTRVVMDTSRGPITLELDAGAAPLHVRSFLYLTGKGFFDGIKFHRHADLSGDGNGFIIQGGDPLTKTKETAEFAGQGGPGYEIPREFNALKHDRLVIAAARSQDPDSAGSQFYITQGAVPFLDEGYTVFGKVVSGQDAALKLRENDLIKNVKVQK